MISNHKKPFSATVPAPAATTYANGEPTFSRPFLDATSVLKDRQKSNEQAFTSRLTTEAQQAAERYRAIATAQQEPSISLKNLIGKWKCHKCSSYNQVVVIAGDHPLGILKCQRESCKHIWCAECPASSAMQIWYVGEQEELERLIKPILGIAKTETTKTASSHVGHAAEKSSPPQPPEYNHVKLPYVYLCHKCGLTHRAIIKQLRPENNENRTKSYWGFGPPTLCRCRAKPPFIHPRNIEYGAHTKVIWQHYKPGDFVTPWTFFRLAESTCTNMPNQANRNVSEGTTQQSSPIQWVQWYRKLKAMCNGRSRGKNEKR